MKAKRLLHGLTAVICLLSAIAFYGLNPFGLTEVPNRTISVAVLMIALWVTQAVPMPAVALLPLVLFPLFGIETLDATATAYANSVIFLFFGGGLIALVTEKWNLHRRMALNIVLRTGTSGNRIILGFILATGFISTWLSNTATTLMMLPIAVSFIEVMKDADKTVPRKSIENFSLCLMLSIALASNLAIGTIIGTPANVAYVGYINKRFGQDVSMVDWMYLCMPLSLLLLLFLYFVMVKWLFPNRIRENIATHNLVKSQLEGLGKISVPEKRVFVVFVATALLWMTKDLINQQPLFRLDDTMIALIGGLSLFFLRSGEGGRKPLLVWDDTKKLAWGILLLIGGGIALASALEKAGLIQELGHWLAGFAANELVLIFLVTFVSLFVSEVMSNVAQVIVFAPVVTSLAEAAGMHPYMLGIPMALAASCASMLPMGTPPNAIAFSSGYIRLEHMLRVGIVMNVISVLLITLFCWLLLPVVFGT